MVSFSSLRAWQFRYAWAVVLLLLIPIKDTRSGAAELAYEHARQLFLHGSLKTSQSEAALGYTRYHDTNSQWASKFQLLEAEVLVRRGMDENALQLLALKPLAEGDPEQVIQKLTIQGLALAHRHEFSQANQKLTEAASLCATTVYRACGAVPMRRGILANRQGQLTDAKRFFLESLSFARTHQDQWSEATALLNLGYVALQNEHYDEAVSWSRSAYRSAVALGAEDQAQAALGNLGWAYLRLGDNETALGLFVDAERHAAKLGDIRLELKWVTGAGYVYRDSGDLARAILAYRQSLELARQINSKDDIVNALEDLAHASIDAGKLEEATAYIDQVNPLIGAGGNRLDTLDVMLAQARIAAARRQDIQAESVFRAVERDPASQISMRLGAEHQLAKLFEREGKTELAARMYKTALTTFESARTDLKNENSKLPFLANATSIYSDYIRLLVSRGKPEEALLAADQSRARTLAQGLGLVGSEHRFQPDALSPRAVARKTGATLLFYWLGEQQSYLWAITPERVSILPLPAQKQIAPLVERYSKTLLGNRDPAQAADQDGQQLFRVLVAPALKLIPANIPVAILADGALTRLNFETLLAPGPGPASKQKQRTDREPATHYWIEDATLFSAPSLAMLASAKPAPEVAQNLLLMGDPIAPSDDFPSLPFFAFEMKKIEKDFAERKPVVFAGRQASPAAYLASNPARYSYIHFVAHAVASRTDPLDSAIILSPSTQAEDSFKLYAREIMQHPISARLVTISACFGSGTRFYAGEGLVGLSWAFLRAGAHGVIGALWEVSDESTPRLMDALYRGLKQGQAPAEALRAAKLALLHSQSKFGAPFYWAPFQLYSRL